jgi:hypothetical protein
MAQTSVRVAILYQALEPPVINGVRKPKKPGGIMAFLSFHGSRSVLTLDLGYQDSGADIAYALSSSHNLNIITPTMNPIAEDDSNWCFPDTEEGIKTALDRGATHLWANTILFASHPLQQSSAINSFEDKVKLVGQPPLMVEQYDDKEFVNELLRRTGGFDMPRAWYIKELDGQDGLQEQSKHLPYPVIAKPIRGRGSHGVKLCTCADEFVSHGRSLLSESPAFMVEEYLSGEEATITVMPPTEDKSCYWVLPPVTRFNHQDGVAPYNGIVAVVSNSRAVINSSDMTYEEVMRQCERAAALLGVTAPIRIDVRRYRPGSKFALFDVNMKPVRL